MHGRSAIIVVSIRHIPCTLNYGSLRDQMIFSSILALVYIEDSGYKLLYWGGVHQTFCYTLRVTPELKQTHVTLHVERK